MLSERGSWCSEISTVRGVLVPEKIKKNIDQSFIVDKMLCAHETSPFHNQEEEEKGEMIDTKRRKSLDLQMPEESEASNYFRD